MAQARGNKAYVDLSAGIITEASPLDFPTNASSDELNMLFDKDERKRVRRPGLSVTQGDFASVGSAADDGYVADFVYWRDLQKFVSVVMFFTTGVGWRPRLIFHDEDQPYVPMGSIDLPSSFQDHKPSVSLTEVKGNLALCIEGTDPLIVVPRPDNEDTLDVFNIGLYVRDFTLIDDSLDITERPPSLTQEHEYNLINAGWYQLRRIRGGGGGRKDPIEAFAEDSTSSLTALGDFVAPDEFQSFDSSLTALSSQVGEDITISGSSQGSNNGTAELAEYSTSGSGSGTLYTLRFVKVFQAVSDEDITFTTEGTGGYPSNADVAYLGMVPTSDGSKLEFDANFLEDQTLGNTPAARGHYVYPIDDLTRSDKLLNREADGAVENTLTLWGTVTL